MKVIAKYWKNGSLWFRYIYVKGKTYGLSEFWCDDDGVQNEKDYRLL